MNSRTKMLLCLVVIVLVSLLARMMIQLRDLEERVWILEHQLAMGVSVTGDTVVYAENEAGNASVGTLSGTANTVVSVGKGMVNAAAFDANGIQYTPPPDHSSSTSSTPSTLSTASTPTPSTESRKFSQPHLFDLNAIDSLTLIRIPGIAGRTASLILDYRQKLGGFYHPRQLSERLNWESAQQQMDEWCARWFVADTTHINRLQVNCLAFRDLLRHPYLEYPQVQDLVQYRDRHKRIPDLSALRQMPSFTEADIQRLSHYLSFE